MQRLARELVATGTRNTGVGLDSVIGNRIALGVNVDLFEKQKFNFLKRKQSRKSIATWR